MRVALVAAVLLLTVLAGCSGGKKSGEPTASDEPTRDDLALAGAPVLYLNVTVGNETHRFSTGDAADGTASATASGTNGSLSASATATAAPGNGTAGNATGQDMPSGDAPLNVTFTLGAAKVPAAAQAGWTFDFGRSASANATAGPGNATGTANGTSLPATLEHSYTEAGDYNVTFILRVGNATPQALQATLHIGGGANVSVTKPLPDQLHFEFGESLGCTADVSPTGIACVSFELGPQDGDGIDGFWIELTDLYWGLSFTSTVGNVRGDSDAAAVDADLAVMPADVSGGGTQATGVIPDGAAWLFIYSYAEPSTGITVDFAPPA